MSAAVLNRITLVLASVGLFIAGVLSLAHYMNRDVPCMDGGGCATVANHPSSMWFGIPVALFGFGAYLTIATLAAARGAKGIGNCRGLVMAGYVLSAIGAVVSVALTYYAITVIRAECLWCIASAIVMTLLLFTHAGLAQKDVEPGEGSSRELKFFAMMLGLVVVALGIQGTMLWNSKPPVPKDSFLASFTEKDFIPAKAHILGDKNAPITLVEFGDLLCPSCRHHFPDLQSMVKDSNGKLRLVFRHFPMYKIPGHEESVHAAVMSEIADESAKFWPFVSETYQLEDESVKDPSPLLNILDSLGISSEKAMKRVDDAKDPAFLRVYQDISDGSKLGVHGTPTFFVLAPGAKPHGAMWDDLKSVFAQEPYKSILNGKS